MRFRCPEVQRPIRRGLDSGGSFRPMEVKDVFPVEVSEQSEKKESSGKKT